MLSINSNKVLYEPRHEKTNNMHMRNPKAQISFAVTAKLISAFIFATQTVQFSKSKISSLLPSSVTVQAVRTGLETTLLVFPWRGSYTCKYTYYRIISISQDNPSKSCHTCTFKMLTGLYNFVFKYHTFSHTICIQMTF